MVVQHEGHATRFARGGRLSLAAPGAWPGTDRDLTALLLAGGADGVHKVVSTITSFLDATKERAKAPAPGTTIASVETTASLTTVSPTTPDPQK